MVEPEQKRILVLGDSQSVALKDGCDALGLTADLLSFSGNYWHAGHIVPHRRKGVWARGLPLQKRIGDVLERSGRESLLGPDVIVVASFGFHLGRVAPALTSRGHRASPAEFLADDDTFFVSAQFLAAYVETSIAKHAVMMRHIGRSSKMLLVCPPRYEPEPVNYRSIFHLIKDRFAQSGIIVCDPAADLFGPDGFMPDRLKTADGFHGSPEYGEMAMRLIVQQGLLPPPR